MYFVSELALQIEDHAKLLSKFIQPAIRTATIFGSFPSIPLSGCHF